MFDTLKKPYALITLAIIAAVAFACFHSFTITYLLILTFCGYKCWDFANQGIVRHKPQFSLFLLFTVLIFCGKNDSLLQKEIENGGSHIVSGVVTERYTTTGSKGRTNYHTIVEYEARSGIIRTKDVGGYDEYNNTTEGQNVIIAEPFSEPGRFIMVEYHPTEELVEKMRHGIYAKGSLSNLNTIQDDEQVRADFENYDKPGPFDFFKNHTHITIFVLVLLSFVLSFFGDKMAVCSVFGGVALVTLLSMLTHDGFFAVFLSMIIFCMVLVLGNLISQKARVKNEIKNNGGYITTGECVIVGSGKNSHAEVIFTDAMGNPRSEKINKNYGQKIIIAHSTFNDIEVICLDEKPTQSLLCEYQNGKFIGPCSKIDIYKAQEDEKVRSQYEKLYTPRAK